MRPTGSFGAGFSLPVAVSSRCRTLRPSSFVSNAIVFPSGERAKLSTSHGMCDVREVCFPVARSR